MSPQTVVLLTTWNRPALRPSVVYDTGRNGLHVYELDVNCVYGGSLDGVHVE